MRQPYAINKVNPSVIIHSQWAVATLMISNPTISPIAVAIGRTDVPTLDSADFVLPAGILVQLPVNGIDFALAFMNPLGLPALGNTATIGAYSKDEPIAAVGSFGIQVGSQQAPTTLDILDSVQPINPPASTDRLWVDVNHVLHMLDSGGNDRLQLNDHMGPAGVLGLSLASGDIAALNGRIIGGPIEPGSIAGDLHTTRVSAPTQGAVFFGNGGGQFVYYNGTDWVLSPLLRGSQLKGIISVADDIRSTGLTSGPPATGTGLEILWDGTSGYLACWDRGAGVAKDIFLQGHNIINQPQSGGICLPVMTSASAALGADVTMVNQSQWYDGPSMGQGAGEWFAWGTVTLIDPFGTSTFIIKLYDGTTTVASGAVTMVVNTLACVTLKGRFASAAGNIRMAVQNVNRGNTLIKFNQTGSALDSNVFGFRNS